MIPISRPVLGDAEVEAARRAILSGWVTQGPEVGAFEAEFAALVGAPHACAVSSATTALHLALLAAGVGPGDEVITVSHSFIATANAVRYCGAEPIFVDIEPDTFNIDVDKVAAAMNPRTRAVLAVHQIGMPCDLRRLVALTRDRGVFLVEDAACAAGSEIRVGHSWERIGLPHGDAACFSFHPRKVITTGDGGMITTKHAAWDAKFRLWRQHGMSLPDTVRHGARKVMVESYPVVGFNYRLTDIQAAVGRAQLRRLPGIIERRRALAARYAEKLAAVPGLRPPIEPAWARSNWQSYCVWLPPDVEQRVVMQAMLDQGVAVKPGVMCAHREAPYAAAARRPLPCSEAAHDRTILLPLYPQMTDAEQDTVITALKAALVPVHAVVEVRR